MEFGTWGDFLLSTWTAGDLSFWGVDLRLWTQAFSDPSGNSRSDSKAFGSRGFGFSGFRLFFCLRGLEFRGLGV